MAPQREQFDNIKVQVSFVETRDDLTLTGLVSEDRLKLFIDVERVKESKMVSRDDLLTLLGRHIDPLKIEMRVLDDIVVRLRRGENPVLRRRILSGQPSTPGIDGKLIISVMPFSGKPELSPDTQGVKDLANLHLFDNIERGQVIGRVYPPTPGEEGHDVFGNSVKAIPGQPAPLAIDHTISVESPLDGDKSYKELVARNDGFLAIDHGHYSVRSHIMVLEDVDFRWGNIDFVGSIKIKGDVMPGFSIKARQGIDIEGSVRGGSLITAAGSIRVRDFAYGGPGSMIISGGELHAGVVQEVNTEVLGDIHVAREASNSTLRSAGAIFITDGALIGGQTYAVRGVEASIIGNEAGISTLISLSSDIEASLAYSQVVVGIEVYNKEINHLRLQLGPLAEDRDAVRNLREDQQSRILPLVEKLESLVDSRRGLFQKKMEMLEMAKFNKLLRVNVLQKMYEGAIIRAAGAEFRPTETIQGPCSIDYRIKEKKFVTGAYRPLPLTLSAKEED